MHRMIRNMVTRLTLLTSEAGPERLTTHAHLHRHVLWNAGSAFGIAVALLASSLLTADAMGQGYPQSNYDMTASGFVTPAGMPPIGPGGMPPAGMNPMTMGGMPHSGMGGGPPMGMGGPQMGMGGPQMGMGGPQMGMGGPQMGMGGMPPMGMGGGSPVMPVGFNSNCDGCESYGGMPLKEPMDRMVCGSCGGGGGCSCNSRLGGGILGKMRSGKLGLGCLFCRGSGCTACRNLPFGHGCAVLAGCVGCLAPCKDISLCSQRWYDLSLEGLFLGRNIGGISPGVITTQGVAGTPVLSMGDLAGDELESGVRLSIAMICGVGGNLEFTYMGGNEWSDTATATSATPTLFSYISDYGTQPGGALSPGFDDTDRSLEQSIRNNSEFDSAEINYRRRSMFPYCRFQSSWLVGLRYIRYRDSLLYQTTGLDNDTVNGNLPRYFSNKNDAKNHYFGPQTGFDFWWNIHPGISMGIGAKLAWMQNDYDRRSSVTANSVPLGNAFVQRTVTEEEGDRKGALMGDFEWKLVYRFSHSWSFRGSYYAMGVENAVFGGLDPNLEYPTATSDLVIPPAHYENLVVQGFTLGTEYIW